MNHLPLHQTLQQRRQVTQRGIMVFDSNHNAQIFGETNLTFISLLKILQKKAQWKKSLNILISNSLGFMWCFSDAYIASVICPRDIWGDSHWDFYSPGKGNEGDKAQNLSYSAKPRIPLRANRHNVAGNFVMAFPAVAWPCRSLNRKAAKGKPQLSPYTPSWSKALLPGRLQLQQREWEGREALHSATVISRGEKKKQ